jgi:CheY-like chemotaxis protein
MKNILVVDDDITTRTLLKMLLEMEGFNTVIPSTEIEDIFYHINSDHPDVLFIDVHLQHITGIEVVKKIRANPNYTSLRILMTSGMDVQEKCIEAGANGFLLKPFMPDELITWIKNNTGLETK